MLCCFISEDVGIELIDRFNIDNVCWESDYPHSDTDWPNAPEVVAEVMAPLNDGAGRQDHPRERDAPLPLRPVRDTARRSDARLPALRAESPDVDTVTRVGRPSTERDAEIFKLALRGIKAPVSGQ